MLGALVGLFWVDSRIEIKVFEVSSFVVTQKNVCFFCMPQMEGGHINFGSKNEENFVFATIINFTSKVWS